MDIRVISLLRSASRRASIEQQFAAAGVAFEFFDAITPAEAPAVVNGYDEAEFVLNCGRGATDTEIACYASHLALWRECAAAGRPLLILEDDAQLSRSFGEGLAVLTSEVEKLGFVRAALPIPTRSARIGRRDGFALHYCYRVPLQALGYAISPRAAQRLVQASQSIEEPVDKFMQRFWRHGQRVYALLPAIVEHSSLAADSEIGARVRDDYRMEIRVRRLLRKSVNSLARTFSNAGFSPGR